MLKRLSVRYIPTRGDVVSAGLTVLNSKLRWEKVKVVIC